MERTSHRSIEGVCSYKRTSDAQQEALSDILNRPQSWPQQTASAHLQSRPKQVDVHVVSANDTKQTLSGLSFPSSTFNNCTININVGSSVSEFRKRKRAVVLSDSDDD